MLDYLGILKELNRRKIKYIVVGGLAVNFYGVPRMTYDIDLLLYMTDDNIKRFTTLMKKWGFKPKVPVNIADFADKSKRSNWNKNKNMKAFSFVNPDWPISEIDIIIDSPIDYKKAARNLKRINLMGISIPTISIGDLIAMKKKSGRAQDKEDIRNLKKILR